MFIRFRPETEEWTVKLADTIKPSLAADLPRKIRILDLCCGSGCIALTLASRLPPNTAEIVGVDKSADAILLADENLSLNERHLNNSITFHQLDLNEDMQAFAKSTSHSESSATNITNSQFDIVVSNPPYVSYNEYCTLDNDVKDWEDPNALVPNYSASNRPDNDDDGLGIIRRIALLIGSGR